MPKTSIPIAAALAFAHFAPAQTFFLPPPTPVGNPTTASKALLGKALFWDEQLSSSRTVACGTCHIFGNGGSDPRSAAATHPGPDGVYGTTDDIHGSPGVVRQDSAGVFLGDPVFAVHPQSTTRHAPSPINAAYESQLFWDGRATGEFRDPATNALVLPYYAALESQAAGPPVSDVEMGHLGRSWTDIATDIANLAPLALAENIPGDLQALIAGQTYQQLFDAEFGAGGVTPQRIIFAIAAYERTLISDQSPYDRHQNGFPVLTTQQSAGFAVFANLCINCHVDLLTPNSPTINDFRIIGARPPNEDTGRFGVTGNPNDIGSFKTPGLRNVALRAPFMHSGNLATLNDVISFYNRGGDFGPGIDPTVVQIAGQISATDRANLLAFFDALTDPRVQLEQPPFDRPTLWSESSRAPQHFGVGTAGTGGFVPQVVASAPAHLGNGKFGIGLAGALPGVPHFFVLDFAGSAVPVPFLGQNVYLAFFDPRLYFLGNTQGALPGGGWSAILLPIPNDPYLAGLVTLYGQWLIGDPAGPSGLTSTGAFSTPVF